MSNYIGLNKNNVSEMIINNGINLYTSNNVVDAIDFRNNPTLTNGFVIMDNSSNVLDNLAVNLKNQTAGQFNVFNDVNIPASQGISNTYSLKYNSTTGKLNIQSKTIGESEALLPLSSTGVTTLNTNAETFLTSILTANFTQKIAAGISFSTTTNLYTSSNSYKRYFLVRAYITFYFGSITDGSILEFKLRESGLTGNILTQSQVQQVTGDLYKRCNLSYIVYANANSTYCFTVKLLSGTITTGSNCYVRLSFNEI